MCIRDREHTINLKKYGKCAELNLYDLRELNSDIRTLCRGLSAEELLQVGKTNWKKNDYKSDDKITYYEHQKS